MDNHGESSAEKIQNFLSIERDIHTKLASVKTYLKSKFELASYDNPDFGGGWRQFLNEDERPPTVNGTSHGIITLITLDESHESEIVILGKQHIKNGIQKDGGWGKGSSGKYYSTTRITSLAVQALISAKENISNSEIEKGTRWLINAQNDDGGWGNLSKDNLSDTTSTAFALKVLTLIPILGDERKQAIEKGEKWLLNCRNNDYSWGSTKGSEGSVANTSEAIEGLLACGEDITALRLTHEWLLKNIHNDKPYVERYATHLPRGQKVSLIWTQATQERGLIALLRLGSSVTSPEVEYLVIKILERNVGNRYWRSDVLDDTFEPIWGLKEAVIGLKLYSDILQRERPTIVLMEEISRLDANINALCAELDNIKNEMHNRSIRTRFMRILSYLKKPLFFSGVITLVTLSIYGLLSVYLGLNYLSESFLTFLAILGFGLSFYPNVMALIEGKRDEIGHDSKVIRR